MFGAEDFYAKCVKPGDITDKETQMVTLSPINYNCHKLCEKECQAFSRKVKKPGISEDNEGVELNDDVIRDCSYVCRRGEIFTAYIREGEYEEGKSFPTIFRNVEARTGAACIKDKEVMRNNAIKTRFNITGDTEFTINLSGLSESRNKIYMCGRKSLKLSPTFPNIRIHDKNITKDDWNSEKKPQNEWTAEIENQCLANVNLEDVSNKDLWINSLKTHGTCSWNAKNNKFIDTGISLMNGDELFISWFGDYSYSRNESGRLLNREELIKCIITQPEPPQEDKEKKKETKEEEEKRKKRQVTCRNTWKNASTLLIKNFDPGRENFQLVGENARFPGVLPENEIIQLQSIFFMPINPITEEINIPDRRYIYEWHGLTGKVSDPGFKLARRTFLNLCAEQSPHSYKLPFCFYIEKYGMGEYAFRGELKDFSKIREPLFIRPFAYQIPDKFSIPEIYKEREKSFEGLLREFFEKLTIFYSCIEEGWVLFPCDYASTFSAFLNVLDRIDAFFRSSFNSNIDRYKSLEIETIKNFYSKNFKEAYKAVREFHNKGCAKQCSPQDIMDLKETIKKSLADINKIRNLISIDNIISNSLEEQMGSSAGGYEVNIEWGGCPFSNGERIQYAVVPDSRLIGEKKLIPDGDWRDLDAYIIQKGDKLKINSYQNGYLYFRIKPFTEANIPSGINPIYEDLYLDNLNHFGQYNISIQKENDKKFSVLGGAINYILKSVIETLFGKYDAIDKIPKNGGALYKIYDGVTKNAQFIRGVQVLLSLYVIITALTYLIGITSVSREDLIKRLIKIAFVTIVISPGSWQFINNFLIPMFVFGTLEIMGYMISASDVLSLLHITPEAIKNDPLIVTGFLDAPVLIMISSTLWKKIVAMIFGGLYGFLVAGTIIITMFYYLGAILKAAVSYIFALIITSMLLVISPIVLPLILFQQTKPIFDSWFKQLISTALQPIIVFIGLALFNIVIITLLQIVFSFAACETCLLGIDLSPLYKDCWIPGYVLIGYSHFPPDAGGPFMVSSQSFIIALSFFMIGHMAFTLPEMFIRVIGTIVTGSPIRVATTEGPVAAFGEMLQGGANYVTGGVRHC
ncbi:TrbL/VirB6 family protein [Candidatus Cyrtobacter comes]|uniref:type IV secretion system protein n=1 Tax=Candidatus Cyrtobacter comes TaxID=675776 RepID=UPI002ACF0086|nr:type IV secretion system protein [Candidatus Cyrtobacter comes]